MCSNHNLKLSNYVWADKLYKLTKTCKWKLNKSAYCALLLHLHVCQISIKSRKHGVIVWLNSSAKPQQTNMSNSALLIMDTIDMVLLNSSGGMIKECTRIHMINVLLLGMIGGAILY